MPVIRYAFTRNLANSSREVFETVLKKYNMQYQSLFSI